MILDEAGIDALKFELTYKDAQNRDQKHFVLPRRECDLVISGYSVKYRLAIIDRWQELEAKQSFNIPQTYAEALRLSADLSEQNQVLKIENQEMKPKAEFYDTVTASKTVCQMAVAAAVIRLERLRTGRIVLVLTDDSDMTHEPLLKRRPASQPRLSIGRSNERELSPDLRIPVCR